MKKVNILSILFFALLIASCGNKEEESKDKDKKENAQSDEKKDAPEEVAINRGDKAGCPATTNLQFTSETFNLSDFSATATKVNQTMMQSKDQKYESLFIVLANYGEGKVSGYPEADNEVQLTMSFSAPVGKKIEAGTYDASTEGFGKSMNFSANFRTKEKSHMFNLPTGNGVITYLGEDKICGKVTIQNKSGKTILQGDFTVDR